MKHRHTIALLIVSGLMTPLSYGAPRPTSAIAAAKALNASPERLEVSWESSDGAICAFNRHGGGYAIVAADGETIGYSHTGAFDITHIPDALKEILDNIHDNDMFRESTLWDIIPVAPLLGEIAWDQNDPYNMLCPVYYGTQRSATGCAATAMAQIMKYHSYPLRGPEATATGRTIGSVSLSVSEASSLKPVDLR